MACAQVMSGERRTLGSTLVLQGRKQLKQACGLIKIKVAFVLTFIVLKQEFVKETIGQISTHLAQHIFG